MKMYHGGKHLMLPWLRKHLLTLNIYCNISGVSDNILKEINNNCDEYHGSEDTNDYNNDNDNYIYDCWGKLAFIIERLTHWGRDNMPYTLHVANDVFKCRSLN